MRRWRRWMAGAMLVACALARADDGVNLHEIRIGMANALTGPAAGLGLQLRAGANAYVNKVNTAGGVHGRKITLVSVDDAYDPRQTVLATHVLIEQQRVFALFGYVGTPTSAAAVPIAQQAGVPYLFPFSGAEFLRQPANPVVFNLRASYFDEAEALVAYLTASRAKKIGLVLQDDQYGDAGKEGVARAMRKRDAKLAFEARYPRNTLLVDDSLEQMRRTQPDAVIFFGTYRPLAQLVRKARAAGLKTRFLAVSFIGTSELIKHAGADGEGVVISQVMPSPDDAGDPLVKLYHADVAPGARNYGSLEGYADAMLLVEALKRCGPQPSRAALMATLENMTMDLGGRQVAFGPHKHQGNDRVYLTEVRGGRAVPLAQPSGHPDR